MRRLYHSEPRRSEDGEICSSTAVEQSSINQAVVEKLVVGEFQSGDQQRCRRHAAERETQFLAPAIVFPHERRHTQTRPIVGRQRAIAQINRFAVDRHERNYYVDENLAWLQRGFIHAAKEIS